MANSKGVAAVAQGLSLHIGLNSVSGFSVNAGVCIEAHDRAALERGAYLGSYG